MSLLTGLGGTVGAILTPGGTSTTPPTTTTPPATTTPTTPPVPTSVAIGTSVQAWKLVVGETVYRTMRACTGPVSWTPWLVAAVFPDGNGVLIGSGNQVVTTLRMTVGYDLRRANEVYPGDTYPGP